MDPFQIWSNFNSVLRERARNNAVSAALTLSLSEFRLPMPILRNSLAALLLVLNGAACAESGLHLTASNAKITFGAAEECQLTLASGGASPKIVSSCSIELPDGTASSGDGPFDATMSAAVRHWGLDPAAFTAPCYRLTTDGATSSAFHSACDNKGPSLTFITLSDRVIGGYAPNSWDSSAAGYIADADKAAFLFTYNPSATSVHDGHKKHEYRNTGVGAAAGIPTGHTNTAMYSHADRGPSFGSSSLALNDNMQIAGVNYCYGPSTFNQGNLCGLTTDTDVLTPTEVVVYAQ